MLAQLLAAAAPDPQAAKPNTVSPVTATAKTAKPQPADATIDMASDDNAGGDFVAVWPGTPTPSASTAE